MSATDPGDVRSCVGTTPTHAGVGTSRRSRPTARQPAARRRSESRRGLVRSVLRNRKAAGRADHPGALRTRSRCSRRSWRRATRPRSPPSVPRPPSGEHLLGTTAKGQDVLALTLWGARSSLMRRLRRRTRRRPRSGSSSGCASAYFGRLVDDALSLVTNVFLLLPGLPLLVILAAFLPPGIGDRDPRPHRHRLGGFGSRAARAGAVHPRQGLRRGRDRHRRAPAPDHVPRDPPEHGVDRDDHASRDA